MDHRRRQSLVGGDLSIFFASFFLSGPNSALKNCFLSFSFKVRDSQRVLQLDIQCTQTFQVRQRTSGSLSCTLETICSHHGCRSAIAEGSSLFVDRGSPISLGSQLKIRFSAS